MSFKDVFILTLFFTVVTVLLLVAKANFPKKKK